MIQRLRTFLAFACLSIGIGYVLTLVAISMFLPLLFAASTAWSD